MVNYLWRRRALIRKELARVCRCCPEPWGACAKRFGAYLPLCSAPCSAARNSVRRAWGFSPWAAMPRPLAPGVSGTVLASVAAIAPWAPMEDEASRPMATVPVYALPPEAFREARWFAAEQRVSLARTGISRPTHALEAPGSYRVVQVGLDSLYLRAISAVCCARFTTRRHRGARSRPGRGARVPNLSLSSLELWLGWAPARGAAGGSLLRRDREALGPFPPPWGMARPALCPPRSRACANFGGRPCRNGAGPEPFAPDLSLLHEERVPFAANWKLYVENHVDWLHLWHLHENTLGAFDHPWGQITQAGPHWLSFETHDDARLRALGARMKRWRPSQAWRSLSRR